MSMKTAPICPRCGGPLTEPSPWASGWRCALHGEVYPLRSPFTASPDGLRVPGLDLDLPFGAESPRLPGAAA